MARQSSVSRTVLERNCSNENDVIAALTAGKSDVLGQVYVNHRQAALSVIARFIDDYGVAEDLVQETFLLLPRALQGFRGNCSLRTFIIAIAVNLARHHLRTTIRRQTALMRYAEGAESHDSDSPEKTLIQRQLGAAIQRALVRLSPEKQQTFLLREYHEHSSFETARMIAAPEATVRTRVHHARRMLRQALTNDGYESAA